MSRFDTYEIRARFIPTIVLLSPAISILFLFNIKLPESCLSLTFPTVAIIYIASLMVRYLGKRVEVSLWREWGGPPSTTVLRSNETRFPDSTKSKLFKLIEEEFNIDVMGVDEASPDWVERIGEAFRLVRQRIWQENPRGLWLIHNAEYGALRNLYGGAYLMSLIALGASILCGTSWWLNKTPVQLFLLIVSVILIFIPLIARSWWLPITLREHAFRYAESAWSSFISITKDRISRSDGGLD